MLNSCEIVGWGWVINKNGGKVKATKALRESGGIGVLFVKPSALVGGGWATPHPDRPTTGKRPGTHFTGGP